jgi:hypothetical protein
LKLPITFAAFVLMASPAFAACVDVQPSAPTYPPGDPPTASVFFDSFIIMMGDTSLNCALSTPGREGAPVPPAGEISAYSADYRGFVGPSRPATLTVTENGVTRAVVLPPEFEDVMLHSYVGTDENGDLNSDITLSVAGNDEDQAAQLESIDYLLLATTTVEDQYFSLEDVSTAQSAIVTHLNATAGLLVGGNQPLERDTEIGVFGAVGSHTVGATGHFDLDDGFSVDAGAAMFDQSVGGATSSGVLLGGKATWLQPDDGSSFRWLGSAGISTAPGMSMSFSRDYLNLETDTMVSGDGSGSGNLFGIWAEAGVLVAPAPDNEIVFSASLARNWLSFDYAEEQTDENPFALSIDDAVSTYDTVKAKAAWTAAIADDIDLTLHGAVGYLNANDDLDAEVALVGPLAVGGVSEAFVEYGARVGWAFAENARWDVFALGSTGAETGTHAQIGTAVSMKF